MKHEGGFAPSPETSEADVSGLSDCYPVGFASPMLGASNTIQFRAMVNLPSRWGQT